MPWVRLDDRFPSHRKVALLSDRAFRLYVSALCWSSENLTEGRILDRELPVITRIRGTRAAAKELHDAGLWDRTENGWVVHDYLEYNPDRSRVQAERAANAARQQAYRDRKRAEREAKQAARDAASNAPRNGVTPEGSEPPESRTATRARHDGDTNAQKDGLANHSSSQVSAFRNGVSNGTPSPPPTQASLTEKPASKAAGPHVPDFARDLVEQMTAAGMVVGWRLGETEWFAVHAHIKRCGTEALVEFARRRWNPADPPQTARYLTRIWSDLPDMPATNAGLPVLRAIDGPAPTSRQQQETDAWFDRAMTRAITKDQQEAS